MPLVKDRREREQDDVLGAILFCFFSQQWDTSLKVIAEGYAAKCMWNHNPDLEDTGENLFAGTKALDLRQALEEWFLEHLDYNFNNNSCDEDKMCGHYTQMVWAETHRVGCALHLCSTLQGLNWDRASFLVCNYYPAGNYEGERPYVEGDWCSRCPENMQKCENNLCGERVKTFQLFFKVKLVITIFLLFFLVAEDEEADEDDEEGETATWGPIAPSQESTSTFFNLGEQIEDSDEELFVLPAVTVEPQLLLLQRRLLFTCR
uniref:Peptidase inhibitor 16-like n=1 Tax=Cynoglossus semilaevis TaxID=244447 RepID=A0A3P8WWJ7_CYNSE